ncbi:MAG: SAM-dependent chlorinase/fluorinase [Bacteroidales bacterium]
MHFVTLTSDWNNDDFYTGAIKGAILSSCDLVEIITLSNRVKAFGTAEAAFIVRNSMHHFPPDTIHIIAVGSEPEPNARMLAARIDNQYFLCADNGILGLLGDSVSSEVVKLTPLKDGIHESFPELNFFTSAACRLINGEKFSDLGVSVIDYKKQVPLRATLENNTITGTVIYIDSFGNAITNISRELFDRIGKGRNFTIFVQSKHYKINRLNKYYAETSAGDLLSLFNSINLLEIAIRNGSAKDLLNLNTDSTIRVEFK